jgi:signal peptide peptidase SppA
MTTIIDAINGMAWALRPAKLEEIAAFLSARVNGEEIDAALKKVGRQGPKAVDGYETIDGVAVIPIVGTISKRMNMMSEFSGGTSTELVQRDIADALSDPNVSSILLDIESPGGSVDGTAALSDFIYANRGKKPIIAFADGLMASAAYWIGSAADTIVATDTAIVGSIGVAMTHVDRSQQDAKDGVVRTEIYAGKYKRIASGSKPLSEDGAAYLQSMVDTFYEMFVDSVARNRNVSNDQAASMADGREFIGKQAASAGLVDFIGAKGFALGKAKERGSRTVDIKTLQEKHPELFAQVKAQGADEAANVAKEAGIKAERECIKSGAAVTDSLKALFKAEREGREAKLDAMRKAANPSVGTAEPAVATDPAKTTFEAEVQKLIDAGKSRGEATKTVITESPDLHAEYLDRINNRKEA